MKFENIRVYNFENALRGMRNPKNSWHLSDSEFGFDTLENVKTKIESKYNTKMERILAYQNHILKTDGNIAEYAFIGEKDIKLAKALIQGGPEHRKFLRQIFVTIDITAPLYWWKEFDTYKVATVANSTSTMHTIHTTPIELKSFEVDDYKPMIDIKENAILNTKISDFIETLEELRQFYLKYSEMAKKSEDPAEKKKLNILAKWYWKELIRWTPNGWNQTRTVTMNYETLLAMCSPGQRRFHKLNEWSGIDNDYVPNFIKAVRQLPYAQDFIFGDETK